jgi:hypothetical protein
VRWALLLTVLLAGCGGSASDATAPPAPPVDPTLQREVQAGDLAYEMERNEEAAAQYRAALARAQARDDAEAIGDTTWRSRNCTRALGDARGTRAELARRGIRCASRSAAILYGSVLHAKLTAWIGGAWSGAGQASTGSGRTKAGMVRFAK